MRNTLQADDNQMVLTLYFNYQNGLDVVTGHDYARLR
jgi:hypothetical protein